MTTTTHSTLTVADSAYVLEVLQQAQDLPPTADAYSIGILRARAFSAAVEVLHRVSDLNFPIDPLVLGKLRADAFVAASDLRIFGLRDFKIEVKEEA